MRKRNLLFRGPFLLHVVRNEQFVETITASFSLWVWECIVRGIRRRNLRFFISRLVVSVTVLFYWGLCYAQESAHVDGMCLFASDHLSETLYFFPPDKQSLSLFSELLAKSGKDLNVVVKAANVPEVAAATNGKERLLLYNQFALDRFQKEGRKDWRLTMVIGHQIGHHASDHAFSLPPELRIEVELEADRFAGYLMFQLGATIADVQSLTEFFGESPQNPLFPDPKARLAATIEGWHDGKAEVGEGIGFGPGDENIPSFPKWPPPQASANREISRDLLLKGIARPRLMDAASQLLLALDKAEYGERSFYSVPGGFALVSRIEQIYPDGRSHEPNDRWPLTAQPARIFSVASYLQALFTSNPGYYRLFVFVVTNRPLVQSVTPAPYSSPRDWVWAGSNKVPTAIGFSAYTDEVSCTALVYEFRQLSKGSEVKLDVPGLLTGTTHLEKSHLLAALSK
jgi:hypothetical protein